jgi:hypothetical protein
LPGSGSVLNDQFHRRKQKQKTKLDPLDWRKQKQKTTLDPLEEEAKTKNNA